MIGEPVQEPDVRKEDLAAAGIHLDAREAKLASRARRVRSNTRVFPLLRVIGFQLLLCAVLLHNQLVLHEMHTRAVLAFAIVMDLYCVLSWLVLVQSYGKVDV